MPQAPPPDEGSLTPSDWQAALATAVVFGLPSLLPFALFLRPGWLTWQVRVGRAAALGGICLLLLPAIVSIATYPCCTSDVLDYVNRQRLWVIYGGNPYVVVPNDHPEDWSYGFSHFKGIVVAYGPAWWLIARAFTLTAQDVDGYLVGFKVLAGLCFAISLLLIWRLSRPEQRLIGLAFFAWNPIVLIDGLVRVHNDLLTVPFVLTALWLWQRGRSSAALVSLALSMLVKLTVWPIGLVLVVAEIGRRNWRGLVLGIAASLTVVAALYAPFWFGPGTLTLLFAQANLTQWSVGSLLLVAFGPWLGPTAQPVVRLVLGVAWLGLTAMYLRRTASEQPDLQFFAGRAVVVTLIALVCLLMTFVSHYLTPLIAMAALTPDNRIRRLVLALSFGAEINAVLGVDSLAGGLRDGVLDVLCSCVLVLALIAGTAQFAGGAWLLPVRSRRATQSR